MTSEGFLMLRKDFFCIIKIRRYEIVNDSSSNLGEVGCWRLKLLGVSGLE
jgi:hypothetical protein